MSTPPDPHVPGLLLAAARLLGWRPVGKGDLGELYEPTAPPLFAGRAGQQALHVVATGPGTVAWALGDLPGWAPPYLLTATTAAMLAGGAAERDGSIYFEGKCYRLAAIYRAGQHIAEPFEVGCSAA